jgi:hypothetical protein
MRQIFGKGVEQPQQKQHHSTACNAVENCASADEYFVYASIFTSLLSLTQKFILDLGER